MHNRFSGRSGSVTEMNTTFVRVADTQRPTVPEADTCQLMSDDAYDRLILEGITLAKQTKLAGQVMDGPDGRRWWIPNARPTQR